MDSLIGSLIAAIVSLTGAIVHLYWRDSRCQVRLARLEVKYDHAIEKVNEIKGGGFISSCVIRASLPDGRILWASTGTHQMTGWTAEELNGQNVDVLIPEDFREAHHTAISKATELGRINRGPLGVEAYVLHRDGVRIPVVVTLRESSRDPWTVEAQIDRRHV